jgi:hypothetical protein
MQEEVLHNSHNTYPLSFASADNSSLHMNLSSVHRCTIQDNALIDDANKDEELREWFNARLRKVRRS